MLLNELKEILSNLYATYGLTQDTLRLSKVVDVLINQEMKN